MGEKRLSRRGWLGAVAGVGVAATVGCTSAPSESTVDESDPRSAFELVFEDNFDDRATIDTDGRYGPAVKWYTDLPWREVRTPSHLLEVSNSVLTIDQEIMNGNWAIATRSPWTGQGSSFHHGYFEAKLAFDPQPTASWREGFPAFWSLPIGQQDDTPDRHYAEIDFFEAITSAGGRYDGHVVGVVHDITLGADYEQEFRWFNLNNRSGQPLVTDDSWHVYGCLWQPGLLRWYFDDRAIHEVRYSAHGLPDVPVMGLPTESTDPPRGVFSIADKPGREVSVTIGTGPGWPLRVDWVRIWG